MAKRCWISKDIPDTTLGVERGLATAFDLVAFRLSMIVPVKKSVNHPRTVASMLETGWEQQQQQVRLRSDSKVWSELAFGPVGHCFLCYNQFFSAVMWSLRFPFFWSSVCHYVRFTTIKTRPVNMFLNARQFDNVFLFRRPTRLKEEPTLQYVEEFIFSEWKVPKLILLDIKKSEVAVAE